MRVRVRVPGSCGTRIKGRKSGGIPNVRGASAYELALRSYSRSGRWVKARSELGQGREEARSLGAARSGGTPSV